MKSTVCDKKYECYCFFCGTPTTHGVHHLIFGNGLRAKADEDGLFVPICDKCHTIGSGSIHNNSMAEKLSKMLGQAMFERNLIENRGVTIAEAREQFRKRYGQCYY